MKRLMTIASALCFIISLASGTVLADNVTELMKSAEQNYSAKKYAKALEDLEWARKEIANLQLQAMKKFLPDELDGMKGQDADGGAIFGIHSVSKRYASADGNKSVTITLAAGTTGQASGGLGALMGMAAAFGAMDAGTDSKMVVAKGYKGQFNLDKNTNEGTLIFNLSDGAMINIETDGYTDSTMAEKAAKTLDIPKIEESF